MTTARSLFRVFENPKMATLLLLGFSSGLPLFLTSRTLQAWMTVENVDLKAIGLISLVALPYSLKFLWAPLLDRFCSPLFGPSSGLVSDLSTGFMFSYSSYGLAKSEKCPAVAGC